MVFYWLIISVTYKVWDLIHRDFTEKKKRRIPQLQWSHHRSFSHPWGVWRRRPCWSGSRSSGGRTVDHRPWQIWSGGSAIGARSQPTLAYNNHSFEHESAGSLCVYCMQIPSYVNSLENLTPRAFWLVCHQWGRSRWNRTHIAQQLCISGNNFIRIPSDQP